MYLDRERGMGCDTRGRCKGCWAPRSCQQRPAVARVFVGIPLSPSRGGGWYGSYWLAPHHQSQGAGRRHCGKIAASALFQLRSPRHPCEPPLILSRLTWPSRMDAARVQVGVEVGDPLPEKGSIDAMVVASWSAAHDAHVRHAALVCGVPVFCEKPLTDQWDSSVELARDLVKAGALHLVQLGFQRRFDAPLVQANKEKGTLGAVRTVRIDSRDPRPPPAEYMKQMGSHFYDMVRRLLATIRCARVLVK